MIRGIYTALSGLLAASRRTDVIADNIANVNTDAFKASRTGQGTVGISLTDTLSGSAIGALSTGTFATGPYIDFSQGSLQASGGAFDLALEGPGFFTVGVPGQPATYAYTRGGPIVADAEGFLVDHQGRYLLNDQGERVQVATAAGVLVINRDGSYGDPVAGRLGVVLPAPGAEISRLGAGRFAISATVPAGNDATVLQGFTEMSNVDLASQFGDLISQQSSYNLNAKALSMQDETLADLRSVGRLRG
jgi:flagellar basal body rod protein FlgG